MFILRCKAREENHFFSPFYRFVPSYDVLFNFFLIMLFLSLVRIYPVI